MNFIGFLLLVEAFYAWGLFVGWVIWGSGWL